MSADQNRFQRAFVPTNALARAVEFGADAMCVLLTDGRVISIPLVWFPALHEATPEQRSHCEIGAGGLSLHWPELDEDIAVANLLAGADQVSA